MRKISTIIAAMLLASASVAGQSFQQAFFLDGYRLAYRYNPALQNDGGFLSVGQWENQTRANFGAASFLYPRGDEVVTALHSSVSAQEFLGSLKDDNYTTGNIALNLFSYGVRKGESYFTLESNIRALYSLSIPKEIFEIVKLGTGETTYDLGGMSASGNAIVEVACGYSRKLSDRLSVGARAKLLVGIEALRYNVTRFDMTFTEDAYTADVEANLDLTSRWSKIRTDSEGYLNLMDLSAKDRWKLPSGAGLAVDLGAVYTPVEGLTLSASALDLGGMLWYYGNAGHSKGTTTFTGMQSLSTDDIKDGKAEEELRKVQEEFMTSIKIKAVKSRTALEAVPFNLNLSARYELPFYRPLAVGVSGNYFGVAAMPYSEVRGVLAWNHFPRLGVTANAGVGSYGAVWGAALNASVQNFSLTVAYSDGFGGKVPYTNWQLQAANKVVTVGLTYDL